jgi:hypothetical protein
MVNSPVKKWHSPNFDRELQHFYPAAMLCCMNNPIGSLSVIVALNFELLGRFLYKFGTLS